MTYAEQTRLERKIAAVIAIGSLVLGAVLGYVEVASWTH